MLQLLSSYMKRYSKEQMAQITLIQLNYTAIFGGEAPRYFLVTDDIPQYKVLRTSFQVQGWHDGMGKKSYQTQAKDLISEICAYQIMRDDDSSDPRNLFCEEFKTWCQRLSEFNPDQDALQQVKKRIVYLRKLNKPNTFRQGAMSKMTFVELLSKITKKLDSNVLPNIEIEMTNASAREHFSELHNKSKIIFASAMEFLFYVLRESPGRANTPTNFTFDNLAKPTDAAFKQIAETLSGRCLLELIKPHNDNENKKEDNDKKTVSIHMNMASNPFLIDEEQQYLLSNFQRNAVTTLEACLRAPEAGLVKKITTNESTEIISNFIKLHGYLYEFSKLMTLIKQAHKLAGLGGDLLVYGLAKQGIENLLKFYDEVCRKITGQLKQLAEAIQPYHEAAEKRKDADKDWPQNYARATNVLITIGTLVQECNEVINQISKCINSLSLDERLRQARAETALFYTQINHFLNYWPAISGGNRIELHRADKPKNPKKTPLLLPSPNHSKIDNTSTTPVPSTHIEKASPSMLFPNKSSNRNSSTYTTDPNSQAREELPAKQNNTPAKNPPSVNSIPANTTKVEPVVDPMSGYQPILFPEVRNALNLSGIDLTDDAIASAAKLADGLIRHHFPRGEPEAVEAQKNQIGPRGVTLIFQIIASYPKVKVMNLWKNNIGDIGMVRLSDLFNDCCLRRLDLNENNITATGAEKFAAVLAENQTLNYLDLGYNNLGSKGVVALTNALLKRQVPFNLRLCNTNMGKIGVDALLKCVQKNGCITEIGLGDALDPENEEISLEIIQIYDQVKKNKQKFLGTSNINLSVPSNRATAANFDEMKIDTQTSTQLKSKP